MKNHYRIKELTPQQSNELFSMPEEVIQANLRHDMYYGLRYDSLNWRSAYAPASPDLSREAIFAWHRSIDEDRFVRMGLRQTVEAL